jgi:hypothetical protein
LSTTLPATSGVTEAAYYRFVFAAGLATSFPKPLLTGHTAFSVRFRTARGVRLERPPFSAHRALLTSAVDYAATQVLGSAMREDGIEAFTFMSARDPERGTNTALFVPSALADKAPRAQTPWTCETGAERVTWRERGAHVVVGFATEVFLVEGALPAPAVWNASSRPRRQPDPVLASPLQLAHREDTHDH